VVVALVVGPRDVRARVESVNLSLANLAPHKARAIPIYIYHSTIKRYCAIKSEKGAEEGYMRLVGVQVCNNNQSEATSRFGTSESLEIGCRGG
jgi:hypothetical protein